MFKTKGAFKSWDKKYSGELAFTATNVAGYATGTIFTRQYLAHRVAWAITNGEWPKDQIDHINHDKTDNRISNLRDVTQTENQKNASVRKDNTSGVVGVNWSKQLSKWRARISVSGRNKCLGYFSDKKDAVAARAGAEIECGYHRNHGRIMENV